MIKRIMLIGNTGETLNLELRNSYSTGFLVLSVSGLSPVKNDISLTDKALSKGSIFKGATAGYRNIVIGLKILETPLSVEDNRQKLYKIVQAGSKVKFVIETDNRYVYTDGYIETPGTDNIFSSTCIAQISILCPDIFFRQYGELTRQVTYINSVEPNFEFPFSNESLTENLIEFSIVNNTAIKNLVYNGDSEVGPIIYIDIYGNVEGETLSIYNSTYREFITLNLGKISETVGSVLHDGDTIIINNIDGERSISLLRNGVLHNIFNSIDINSTWIHLRKGDNLIAYTSDTPEFISMKLENDILYDGI